MGTRQPVVLDTSYLESVIQHVLDNHGPSSTLVVCSSKHAFIQQLQSVMIESSKHFGEDAIDQPEPGTESPANDIPATKSPKPPHRWSIPTLRLLASARTLKLAFCEDVTHLRAYLAAYAYRDASQVDDSTPAHMSTSPRLLAVLDLVSLHRPTSNFSAQGLNYTLSLAVEAAHKSGSKLVLAECSMPDAQQADDEAMPFEAEARAPAPVADNVWDEEVSILNVTTKSFGAGERGWVGRTVRLRRIAERWCVFEKLPRREV